MIELTSYVGIGSYTMIVGSCYETTIMWGNALNSLSPVKTKRIRGLDASIIWPACTSGYGNVYLFPLDPGRLTAVTYKSPI